MSANTKIEWTDATWNPIRGCTRVSEGCRNCYAERQAYRFKREGDPFEGLVEMKNGHASWTGKIEFVEKHLLDPLKWKAPRRIFVNSMSDLFHENVTDEMRDKIFAVMALCPQHTFQVLTKRPERMLTYLSDECLADRLSAATGSMLDGDWVWKEGKKFRAAIERNIGRFLGVDGDGNIDYASPEMLPLPNVWLGVSVENQAAADERIPLLLQTPAAVRFISAEPLLGPVNLACWTDVGLECPSCPWRGTEQQAVSVDHPEGEWFVCPKCGDELAHTPMDERLGDKHGLDWVIAGCESGPRSRDVDDDAFRSLRDQCRAAGVPFFLKQMKVSGALTHTPLLDGREWKQFPEVQR